LFDLPLSLTDCVQFLVFCLLNNIWSYEVQAIGWATGTYWYFEIALVVRRIIALALLWALFSTGELSLFLVFSNLVWLVCFAYIIIVYRRRIGLFHDRNTLRARSWRSDNFNRLKSAWGEASLASTNEVVVLHLAYFLLPWVDSDTRALITYDFGRKLITAAIGIYRIFTEGLLPSQIAAAAAGDRSRVLAVVGGMLAMSTGCAAAMAAALFVFSAEIIKLMLGSAGIVPPFAVPIISLLVVLAAPYTVLISVLTYAGHFRRVFGIGVKIGAVLGAGALVCISFDLGFTGFYAAYVIAFGLALGSAFHETVRYLRLL
jgi:O-antigen/teichoic acid export membrane protein